MPLLFVGRRVDGLERDLRAARLSCAAEAKRANRLRRRIAALDAALDRRKAQVAHDQAYVSLLEQHLPAKTILRLRGAMKERPL